MCFTSWSRASLISKEYNSSSHKANVLLLVCYSSLCFLHTFTQKQNKEYSQEKKKLTNAKVSLELNSLHVLLNNNNSSDFFPQDETEL